MNSKRYSLRAIAFISVCLWASCKEDVPIPNQPPDTHISVKAINLTGQDRLNSTVRLSWYGTDADGYVIGYEYAINGSDWIATETQDSTFRFPISPGQDTTDVIFRVRAIDNSGNKDDTPAELVVPLKNSPPVVDIEKQSFPRDTAHLALTFRWKYSDPDGNQTVTQAFLKINEGAWTAIDKNKPLITLMANAPETPGLGTGARLYYNTESQPTGNLVPGFNNGGNNTVYLKVVDISGTESIVDTSAVVFVKHKTQPMLVISGQSTQISNFYKSRISEAGKSFDFVDLNAEGGKYMPYFWNPTYALMLKQYDLLFIHTDQSLMINPSSGNSGILLEFIAPVMQTFIDNGGKSFITTSFPAGQDLALLRGVYPIDSLSSTSGQAVIQKDSAIYDNTGLFPSLKPQNLLLGVDPFVPSVDAQVMYRARLTPFGAWKGPNIVGVKRIVSGKTRQVFFSVELHLFTENLSTLNSLFDQILNSELK